MNEGLFGRGFPRLSGELRALWPTAAVLTCAALALGGLLEIIGPCVWDPVELDVAEVARTHAHHGLLPSAASASIRFFFRVFGVSAGAGRGAMLLFSLFGAAATYLFAARFFSARAGVFALLSLATMPLFFAAARTMTGEIIPLACTAAAFAGLAHATFAEASSRSRRLGSLALGIVAAAIGALSRGALVSFAVPAIAVGLGALYARSPGKTRSFSIALLLAGGAVSLAAIALVYINMPRLAAITLGPAATAAKAPTFDAPVAQIAYALFPWSALVPFSLASLTRTMPRGANVAPRSALLFAIVLSFAAHAALAPRAVDATFAGAPFVAIAIGVSLGELDGSVRTFGIGARLASLAVLVTIGYLVCDDLTRDPSKILEPFALGAATDSRVFPAAFGVTVARGMKICALIALPFATIALLIAAPFGRAFVLRVTKPLSQRRGVILASGFVIAGLVLRVHVYPALLARVAPESALLSFGKKHAQGDRLGLLGVSKRTLAYESASPEEAVSFDNANAAAHFIADDADPNAPRAFLALGARDLPAVNALYRERRGKNAPILAGRGDNVLLAVSSLAPGETNENPLSDLLKDETPAFSRAMPVKFADHFEVLGWDLTRDDGERVQGVKPRSTFHVKIGMRVDAPVSGGFCTFIHIDHTPTRVSSEHKEFAVPMNLWKKGDVVVDDFTVHLPAHFTHGLYHLYYGVGVLPCDDDRRMPVTAGANDGHDRAKAGELEVQ